MTELGDPKRWSADGADVPVELGRLLRAGRDELGTADEVAELARRLAAELGPAAGLSMREPPPADGDAAGAGARSGSRLGARGLGRAAAWVGAGAGAVAAVWFAASSPSSVSQSEPPSIERPAAVERGGEPVPAVPALPPVVAPPLPAAPAATDAPPTATPEPAARELRAARPGTARSGARSSRGSRALAEAALLERAQAALSGNPATALALTREHQRRFPNGALGQEREVIAIEALKRLGRHHAASARAAAFEQRYRGSVHRPRLERSTETPPPPDND